MNDEQVMGMEAGEGRSANDIVRGILLQDLHPREQMELGFRLVLQGLGIDLRSPHFADTPRRAARAWREELCQGLSCPEPEIRTFPSGVDEMIMLRNIPVQSICAHHLLPFIGKATIAYVPGTGQILGLSKLSRITNYFARRPQVQEELTSQIADRVAKLVAPGASGGVGVMIRANHLCMAIRGVNHDGDMITSALRGVFLHKPEARQEFLQLAEMR